MRTSEPLYFGPPERPLFGWLHQETRGVGGTGLVICNPFGYESLCAHRTLRRLAQAAAEAGIPTLRFDYDGCGDSAGSDTDPERLAAWSASVRAAVDALRAHTGVERVCAFGLRLGATIATLASQQGAGLDGLIAAAAVVNGRAYVRELRALQAATDARRGIERAANAAYIESAGFVLSAETQASITAVNLAQSGAPVSRVLLLDRAEIPGNDAWATRLRESGAQVESAQFSGYTEMMLDSHETVVPQEIVERTVRWVRSLGDTPAVSAAAPAPEQRAARARFAPANGDHGAPLVVEESAVRISDSDASFGIVSAPVNGVAPRAAILLLNSGAVHHVGPGRMNVALARRWARLGHVVLRLDLSGLGDSAPRAGEPENVVYSRFSTQDVQRAVDYLRREWCVPEVHTLGLCSGAYHAFKTAVAGAPLASVVLINPLTFFWREGNSLAFPEYRVAADMMRYRTNVLRAESWLKLLRGGVNLRELAGVLLSRARARLASPLRSLGRLMRLPLRDDLHAELRAVAAAGVRLHFVFAENEPGIELLRDQGGGTARRMQKRGRLDIALIRGADHTFTDVDARQQLFGTLGNLLDAPAGAARDKHE